MRSKLPILLIPVVLVFLALIFFLIENLKPKSAGIMVESEPASAVYVNGKKVGTTAYTGAFAEGEIILKLIPQSSVNLFPYETKVKLVSGIKTVVRRNFGDSLTSSSGEILSFEKSDLPDPSVSVVSTPDSAQVSVDGVQKGFTPIRISPVTAGEHQLTVASVGFVARTISIRTIPDYRVTIVVQLSKAQVIVAAQTPAPYSMVEILKTPTGFLRVRSEPTTASDEVAQVHPGEKYKLLTTDKDSGWLEIGLEATKSGWITNQYATITPP